MTSCSSGAEKFDVIILGGGPAGMSAALWCGDLGLRALLIEKSNRLGGQLHHIFNPINNYIGLHVPDGSSLCEMFEGSLAGGAAGILTGVEITAADAGNLSVTDKSGEVYSASAMIIAIGVRRRSLNVGGEAQFAGNGVLFSGSKERETVAGQRVVVVGGGDAAAENALILAGFASRVFLVHRRGELTARSEFLERIERDPRIELILETTVEGLRGQDRLKSVDLKHANGEIQTLAADFLIARIGVTPNTEMFSGKLQLDERGYVVVDSGCRTSVRGIFAVGDVASPGSPTIATAAGMGAAAAKAVYALLSNSKQI